MGNGFINARDFGATGSDYVTRAHSTAGSCEFILADIGDFKVGDEVLVKGCDPHVELCTLFERKDMSFVNRRPWKHNQPLDGRVELDGYDGSQGDWVVYIVDLWPEAPNTFRWTKNFGVEWHDGLEITDGWIYIDGKVRVKINDFKEREWGCTATFVCTSRMVAKVEGVEGDVLTLSEQASITSSSTILHSDSEAIQRAIDTAIAEKKSVFLPNGKYRITKSLMINEPSGFTFEGENGTDTIIDNSLGAVGIERPAGSCFYVNGGEDVTLKNFSMIGCYGFKERSRGVNMFCRGGTSVFGFYFQKSNATCFINTKRVLVENCHARKMSAECFYSMGDPREIANPPEKYTRSITYLRCSVEDCARNAFNNNDKAEGTSILYCRIKDVGNAAWEGASRFVKIHGCYISNTGAVAIGNIRRRVDYLNKLGTAQHIITDNYFEAGTQDRKCSMIKIGSFASQIVVKGNVFMNFNSPAIEVRGEGQTVDTAPENVIISGNSIDLTAIGEESVDRYGIRITSGFVTASDNHIYVRGQADKMTKGIIVSDDVIRASIHDNTIAGVGVGIHSDKVLCVVGDVLSDRSFYTKAGRSGTASKPMFPREGSLNYADWRVHWLKDGTESEILELDLAALNFTLKEPRDLKDGDEFYLYAVRELPWSIHHNIIDNCPTPLSLESYGGERAALDGNIF